jgi:hypothetical protein
MERAGLIPDLQRLSSACHFDCGFERGSWHLIRRYVVMLLHPVQGAVAISHYDAQSGI